MDNQNNSKYRPETGDVNINKIIGGKQEDFELKEELGKGAHGVVIKIQSKLNGKEYVMKKIDLNQFKNKRSRDFIKEAQIQKKLKNPNIIRCYNSFIENSQLYIIMEYAEEGDLAQEDDKKIQRKKPAID